MSRRCWTCNTEHNMDEACRQSPAARSRRAAGGKDDFFDDTPSGNIKLGPVLTAQFESEDSCCGDGIMPGEDIRADGEGGWIHAREDCEGMAW